MPHDKSDPPYVDFMQIHIKVREDYDKQRRYASAFLSLLSSTVGVLQKFGIT